MNSRKCAIFDLDGTLGKGFIAMGFLDYLHSAGVFPESSYDRQMRIAERYRQGKMSYAEWCSEWGNLWAEGLKGKATAEIGAHARRFFEGFRASIYPESPRLVELMREYGYECMLLTMAAWEVASLAAEHLGIDLLYATRLGISEGVYTGSIDTALHLPGGKQQLVGQLGNEYDLKCSFAFGDSASDMEVLELVGNPIALNATDGLKSIAKGRGWPVLISGNIVGYLTRELRKRETHDEG